MVGWGVTCRRRSSRHFASTNGASARREATCAFLALSKALDVCERSERKRARSVAELELRARR